MKVFLAFLVWCVLFALSWPLAIIALVLFPFVRIILLPLRLAYFAVEAVLALIRVILFLAVRILRFGRRAVA
ncbi:MAG TPA: hypothetical protein VJW76_01645 [Verrucomicrobiae bacterium]|nr:hypothetical protein [Verrucomicrobiae bacterium]